MLSWSNWSVFVVSIFSFLFKKSFPNQRSPRYWFESFFPKSFVSSLTFGLQPTWSGFCVCGVRSGSDFCMKSGESKPVFLYQQHQYQACDGGRTSCGWAFVCPWGVSSICPQHVLYCLCPSWWPLISHHPALGQHVVEGERKGKIRYLLIL